MVNILRITMYWYVLLISLGQYMVSFVAVNVLFHWSILSAAFTQTTRLCSIIMCPWKKI